MSIERKWEGDGVKERSGDVACSGVGSGGVACEWRLAGRVCEGKVCGVWKAWCVGSEWCGSEWLLESGVSGTGSDVVCGKWCVCGGEG